MDELVQYAFKQMRPFVEAAQVSNFLSDYHIYDYIVTVTVSNSNHYDTYSKYKYCGSTVAGTAGNAHASVAGSSGRRGGTGTRRWAIADLTSYSSTVLRLLI